MGSKSCPISVKEYSTCGGISLYCILDTKPSFSNSLKDEASMVFVMPSIFLRSSPNRIVFNAQLIENMEFPFPLQHQEQRCHRTVASVREDTGFHLLGVFFISHIFIHIWHPFCWYGLPYYVRIFCVLEVIFKL